MSETNGHPAARIESLLRAQQAGELPALTDLTALRRFGIAEIDVPLIEQLKQQVAQLLRTDVRAALSVAEMTDALAAHADAPTARAIGAHAHGWALHLSSRYDEAVAHYERARRFYAEAARPVDRARIGRALVDALIYLGRYDEALTLASEAREVFESHNEPLLLAQLESNIGNIYHRLDRHQEALASYDRAAVVFSAMNNRRGSALTSYNRANVYCNLDDFRQAQALYEQAAALHLADNDQLGALQARYSIGYLYFLRGAYHQAMRVLHETRSECLQLGDEQTAALCLLDLSEIYLQLNLPPEAAQLAEQARALFAALGMRYETARSLTFHGLAHLRQANLDEAEQSFKQARTEFAAEGNAVQLGLLDLYQAELQLLRGQSDEALPLARAAEMLFRAEALKAKTCSAQLVQARALLEGAAADEGEARRLCEAVIIACAELEAPWLQSQAHELLGDAWLAEGAGEQAHKSYVAAIALIEKIRSAIRVDEFRSAFFRDKLRVYEKLIGLCLADDDPARQAEAFYYLESSKARTLVDLLVNEFALMPPPDDASSAALHQQWHTLRERLHWYQNKIQRLDQPNEKSPPSRRLATDQHLRREIAECEGALSELARQLQAADPHFRWLENTGGMQLDELRALLAQDEVVIEYYFADEALKIFVIDRDGLRIVNSPFSYAHIADWIQKLRFQFDKFRYGQDYLTLNAERLRQHANNCLHELWQALFAPVAELAHGKQLVFIPFGLLHNVPFQALFDGERHLIESHEITVAPSARLLQLCAARAPRSYERAAIFGTADHVAPNITAEVEAIKALFPASACFDGVTATTAALHEQAAASDILHIASHAVFRQDNPMFSAFKLADTWLNFYDICALRLPASLVTLSGCHTGASCIYAGDELMGLARGFLSAGASALVVSLWAVNDPATAKLMTVFYQGLRAGEAPRAALRQAALAMRMLYPHPYYWAPFVLISHH